MEIGFKEVLVGIVILLVVVFYSLKAKYMLTEKVAAKNFETFLAANYGDLLGYTDLRRFFNTGNMNPNCFRVSVYQKKEPRVELFIKFDAKTVATQTDLPPDYPDGFTFHEQYVARIKLVEIHDVISAKMKPLGVALLWDYNEVLFNLEERFTEAEVLEKSDYFLSLFKAEDSEFLGYYHELPLVIRYPHKNAIPLVRELVQEDGNWRFKTLKLYKRATDFETVREGLTKELQTYLEKSYPTQQLYDHFDTYVNPQDFSKLLYIEFTEAKKTKKEAEQQQLGVWVSPVTGYTLMYWNLHKGSVKQVSFVATANSIFMEDILAKEIPKFLELA
ncbi:hypothetical protein NQT66_10035 [Cellulophaga baltica]|uniref:hypothetical protein n=1 Tax=Cellulophaga baltica TaxID=76594 RepID=UPI002149502E|nr:hypothetical protein [Cellulophaga baltica]MCR1025144.1 hypothetical protein [Cellulophaga baltica]